MESWSLIKVLQGIGFNLFRQFNLDCERLECVRSRVSLPVQVNYFLFTVLRGFYFLSRLTLKYKRSCRTIQDPSISQSLNLPSSSEGHFQNLHFFIRFCICTYNFVNYYSPSGINLEITTHQAAKKVKTPQGKPKSGKGYK